MSFAFVRPARRLRRVVLCALVLGVPISRATASTDTTSGPLKLDRETAMWLVALPLACVDKPHDPPKGRGYLYETTVVMKADFAKTRAFYGCSDWHSAVNSTWMMVKVLRTFPNLPVARLIREKLNEHLSAGAIKGEVTFFTEDGDKSFERPYGYAWLLRLHGELRSWDDPDAKKWSANLDPLAKLLLERTTPYLQTLAEPMRIGTHGLCVAAAARIRTQDGREAAGGRRGRALSSLLSRRHRLRA